MYIGIIYPSSQAYPRLRSRKQANKAMQERRKMSNADSGRATTATIMQNQVNRHLGVRQRVKALRQKTLALRADRVAVLNTQAGVFLYMS